MASPSEVVLEDMDSGSCYCGQAHVWLEAGTSSDCGPVGQLECHSVVVTTQFPSPPINCYSSSSAFATLKQIII